MKFGMMIVSLLLTGNVLATEALYLCTGSLKNQPIKLDIHVTTDCVDMVTNRKYEAYGVTNFGTEWANLVTGDEWMDKHYRINFIFPSFTQDGGELKVRMVNDWEIEDEFLRKKAVGTYTQEENTYPVNLDCVVGYQLECSEDK